MSRRNPNPDQAYQWIVEWFERRDVQLGEKVDIQTGVEEEGGAKIELAEFNINDFEDFFDNRNGYESERIGDSVSILKIEELNNGLMHKYAYGVGFPADGKVPLGGYKVPVEESGEPVDDVVEETLELIRIYLEAN